MNNHDDPLYEALSNVPTHPPRLLEQIERRAHTIRTRRRAAVAGIVAVAAMAISVPPLGLMGDPGTTEPLIGPATAVPSEDPELPECERTYESRGTYLDLGQVPDRLRLLWSDDVADPPHEADMVDFSNAEIEVSTNEPCTTSERSSSGHAQFIFVDDDVVIRTVRVLGPLEDATIEEPTRTLNAAGDIVVEIVDTPRGGDDTFDAEWMDSAGQRWVAWVTGPMEDDDLIELAESVRWTGETVDLSGWSGTELAAYAWDNTGDAPVDDDLLPSEHDNSFNIRGDIQLIASDDGNLDELWQSAYVGDEIVDVNGQLGVLGRGDLRWVTEDGVAVSIFRASHDDALEIARSVKPVPADEPRLADVWITEADEDLLPNPADDGE